MTTPDEQRTITAETPEPASGKLAYAEMDFFGNKLVREESVRRHIHWASLITFWAFVITLWVVGGTWLYHLLMPVSFHFLTSDQIRTIQVILITATSSSFITSHSRRWLKTSSI